VIAVAYPGISGLHSSGVCAHAVRGVVEVQMRALYSLFMYLLVPVFFARLALRARNAPAYWQSWGERLGFFASLPAGPSLWVHAVSVGEFQAALPLIRALQQRYPQCPLVVTTTTPTGRARAQAALGNTAHIGFLPYDLPDAVDRFLDRAQPRLAVVVETELWPNLFRACRRRRLPLFVVNGRLSDKSYAGYRRVRSLVRATLADVTAIAARSDTDAQRFIALGASPARVHVAGNIKFDMALPPNLAEAARWRAQWGRARPVWIAASTHEGEDAVVLEAHARVRQRYPGALLILVPRHPERFASVRQLVQSHGFAAASRSAGAIPEAATAVYLGDTMGELLALYATADVAFVGGSLVPVGGHNPLEPAALGLPVLSGPHVFNFTDVNALLRVHGVVREVTSAQSLAEAVVAWLEDEPARRRAGVAAKRCVELNRGAVARIVALIGETVSTGAC
jgi:3-deoxy-D-manno-octulosonic-acid transferase